MPLADYHSYTPIWAYAFVWNSISSCYFQSFMKKYFLSIFNDLCLKQTFLKIENFLCVF